MSAQATKKIETIQAYDDVPYESFAYSFTHPSHLSTVATLFGLTPPDFRTARVLELGCAAGGNLLPLALLYPRAHFLGVDLSQEQVSHANRQKEDLKLSNLEFIQQDILNFSPQNKAEKFDYIICHGILSWVPETVREKIFAICNEWLSPNGLAVISYNTLPGWNSVRSLREMMLYHTSRFTNPAEKLQQARSLLAFLSENAGDKAGYRAMIDDEIKQLDAAMGKSSYLYHDHLESVNVQFYLHEFSSMAQAQGLSYVGDTNFATMFVGNMPPKALEKLQVINDVVGQEQYMDFVTNRRFRSSILCKDIKKMNRNLRSEQIMDYYLTLNGSMEPVGLDPNQDIVFKSSNASFTTHEKITGTLFLELYAAGQKPVAAGDLVSRVQKKLGLEDARIVREALINFGLPFALKGFVNIYSDSPACVNEVSEKPVAFSLARHEAGRNNATVTNVLCCVLPSNEAANILLKNMDGSKTVQNLADILMENVHKGRLTLLNGSEQITDENEIRREISNMMGDALQRFAKNGLLIG